MNSDLTSATRSPQIVTGTPAREYVNTEPAPISALHDAKDEFAVARSVYNGFDAAYLLQGANGPCPIVALCNVLLLKGVLSLPNNSEKVSFEYLVDSVANIMIDKNNTADADETLRSTLESSVQLLSSLNRGLDVNVSFTSVEGFEYTPEMSIFDLVDVRVYHGWIVSEEDFSAYPYVSQLTYDQAVEKVAAYEEVKAHALKCGDFDSAIEGKKDVVEEGEAIAKWLESTKSQLTSDGLIQLHTTLQDGDIGVLFRNNHFSVIHKRENHLFSLVTDIGFRRTSNAMWESLDQLNGDALYLDSSFRAARQTFDIAGVPTNPGGLGLAGTPVLVGQPAGRTVDRVHPNNVQVVSAVRPSTNITKKKKKRCTIM
jgi:hypothetical protein